MIDLSLKGKDRGQDPEKGRKIDLSPKEKDLGQDLGIGESPDQERKIDLSLKGRGPDLDLDLETREIKDQGITLKIFSRVWNKDGKSLGIDQGQDPETGDIRGTDRVKEKDQVGLILEIAGDHILERKKLKMKKT